MGKRGLSSDEKKAKLKAILQDSQQPFTLKQLEKLGSKAGVTQMSIKPTLEEMVSDQMIDMEKIGSTNWFWSFPSKELGVLQEQCAKASREISAAKKEVAAAKRKRSELEAARVESEERTKLLAELRELRAAKVEQDKQLGELKANDPSKAADLAKKVLVCQEAANRWTENVWQLVSFIKKKYGKNQLEVSKMLGLESDFDVPVYEPKKKKKKAKK